MPGIVGLVTKKPREWAEPQLLRMIETLRHESFYVSGTWIDESLGIYVGWVARQNSHADEMPLRNETGDVVLVFSGEEFPDPGMAGRLKQHGHKLNGNGTSHLVHIYEDDPKFPAGLNGRFHGLLIDRPSRSAMLFNDRYGLQRLYYHESKEAFYFAAEAKAILAVRPELRSADSRGLADYITCGCVLENRTLFRDIHLLPTASAWILRDGSVERKSNYFQPKEWEQQDPLEPEAYYREFRDVFTRNLPRYFDGGERVGVSLTGGLDTRMIMAWHKYTPESLPCYSFGGAMRDSQDVLIARKVARACGQQHEVIPVGDEFLSRFPHYAERTVYFTDGSLDVQFSPVLYVNELARGIAPVRMTGNYGGEILRRLRALKAHKPNREPYRPEFLPYIDKSMETHAGLTKCHPLSFIAFRQTPWHHYGLLALEESQLSLRSPYLDNDLVRTAFRGQDATCQSEDVALRLIGDAGNNLLRIRTDLGLAGNAGPLSQAISRKILKFTFKADYAYNYGMPQWLAQIDHLVSPLHLERLFLGRHKYYHFRIWYRDALSKYIQEMLLDSRTLSRPYLDRKNVERMVQHHVKGDRNYTTEIHKMLTLELTHRLLIEQ
jgi:asparagine synthase (glutamine-hydrolysing)